MLKSLKAQCITSI